MKKLIIFGLGLHARHHHFPMLEALEDKYEIQIKCIVDLKSQEKYVMEFLAQAKLKPEKTIFLEDQYRVIEQIPAELKTVLDELHHREKIDGVIISTEPKSHKAYALWAISNHIDVLLDKPITAPVMNNRDEKSAAKIKNDYEEMERVLKNSRSNVVVMAIRRHHPALTMIKRYLATFIAEFEIPLTYIGVYHSEGMWNMPGEFFSRENHPYKYGYGLMLHSGYHFVDVFLWLGQLNRLLLNKTPDVLEFTMNYVTPYDFLHQVNEADYRKLFHSNKQAPFFQTEYISQIKNFGELDVNLLCQLKQGDAVITTGAINLLQSSYSSRAWIDLPLDTYKKNGRTYHESFNIQVGHLLNIQAQCLAVSDSDESTNYISMAENPNNYRVMIFRNHQLAGGKSFEQYFWDEKQEIVVNQHKLLESMGGIARMDIIRKWLEGNRTESNFGDHKNTIQFLTSIYEFMFRKNKGDDPYPKANFRLV